VLWRVEHGEVEGLAPRTVVLMIGTNNIGSDSTDEIARGVEAIVTRLREKLPRTRLLLLGVFPRGTTRDKEAMSVEADPRPGEINVHLRKLDDLESVTYLDLSQVFLDDDGKIPRGLMPDFLHLSDDGYRRWAEAIEPVLWRLMEEGER
jgi:beta-glucosidase